MNICFRCVVAGCVLLTFLGCAPSTGATRIIHPAIVDRQTSLDNILVTVSSSVGGVENEMNSLKDQITSGLRETHWFAKVGEANTDIQAGDGIKVSNEIMEIKKISENAREWTGALAGQAKIGVRVTISDLKTGKEIEIFEVEGKSAKAPYAGTTDEAIERAAEQVVTEILRINARTAQ